MSQALYGVGGLRFWSEAELEMRAVAVTVLHRAVVASLTDVNRAWSFERCEAPVLTPRDYVSPGYDADDLWLTRASMLGGDVALRPETTPGTYAFARRRIGTASTAKVLPACFWQVGKSYRRETNDGASAAKLRFNEFTQAEWQCLYRADSHADYRPPIEAAVERAIGWLTAVPTRRLASDRLPAYSRATTDIEATHDGAWREICSISTRTDFAADIAVLEVAVGLDRIVEVRG